MNIKIKVKQLSKLKDVLTYINYCTQAITVKDLITEMVAFNVREYNAKRDKKTLFLLSDKTIEALVATGKIDFGQALNTRKVDVTIMQEEALFQFKNDRFIILNETTKHEYKTLDEPLLLSEGDALVFIKLTLLSGRGF